MTPIQFTETAIRHNVANVSEITATDLRRAADWIRNYDSVLPADAAMTRIADALDASADDMDRPVSLSDVLASFAAVDA